VLTTDHLPWNKNKEPPSQYVFFPARTPSQYLDSSVHNTKKNGTSISVTSQSSIFYSNKAVNTAPEFIIHLDVSLFVIHNTGYIIILASIKRNLRE
jgi:hypothetical protein